MFGNLECSSTCLKSLFPYFGSSRLKEKGAIGNILITLVYLNNGVWLGTFVGSCGSRGFEGSIDGELFGIRVMFSVGWWLPLGIEFNRA